MTPFLASSYDRFLCAVLSCFVRRPRGALPTPHGVPAGPEDAACPAPIILDVDDKEEDGLRAFRAPSPVSTPWKNSRDMRGRLLGPDGARNAVIVLHGACDNEYTYCQWMGRAFAKAGFRVVVPAAPCHLDRAEDHTFSGAPLFWSTDLVTAGIAQWLTEIHGLVGWLRGQGAASVGILGYSLGSLVGGLAATLWPELDFVALLAPVGHHLHAIQHSRAAACVWPWMRHTSPAEAALLDRWAPLYRRPVVQRLLFLKTMHDVLQPTELQQNWWRDWGRPPAHEYPHGHMSVLFCRQMYRDLEAFAAERVRSTAETPVLSP
jgi:dienelactone hydrolase